MICRGPSDPCHIKTRGSGGDDVESNLIPMCRQHHTEQGQIGWVRFCAKYPKAENELAEKGWRVFEVFGISKLIKI